MAFPVRESSNPDSAGQHLEVKHGAAAKSCRPPMGYVPGDAANGASLKRAHAAVSFSLKLRPRAAFYADHVKQLTRSVAGEEILLLLEPLHGEVVPDRCSVGLRSNRIPEALRPPSALAKTDPPLLA